MEFNRKTGGHLPTFQSNMHAWTRSQHAASQHAATDARVVPCELLLPHYSTDYEAKQRPHASSRRHAKSTWRSCEFGTTALLSAS